MLRSNPVVIPAKAGIQVRLKEGATLVASYNGDPFMACWRYQAGRTAIFASDFAPHWAGDFVHWPYYAAFWRQMVHWLAGRS